MPNNNLLHLISIYVKFKIMISPKVSIIVPVYKAENNLNRCVDSLLAQTFTDFEVLLIDDGSPDKSGEICDEYAKKDTRIRIFHKENGGVSSARNLGIKYARGEWMLFVDSDDWCEPNYVSSFWRENTGINTDLVLQGRSNENGNEVTYTELTPGYYKRSDIPQCMLDNNLLSFGAPYCKLYSKQIIDQYNIQFPVEYSYGEDTTFFFKYLSHISSITIVEGTGYHYVTSDSESLSSKNHKTHLLFNFIIDSIVLIKKLDTTDTHLLYSQYCNNCIPLIGRALINMYRLGYSKVQRFENIKRIKHDILPLIGQTTTLEFMNRGIILLAKSPINAIDFLLKALYIVRK